MSEKVAVTALCWIPKCKENRKCEPYQATDAELEAIDEELGEFGNTEGVHEEDSDSDEGADGEDLNGKDVEMGDDNDDIQYEEMEDAAENAKKKKSSKAPEKKEKKQMSIEEEFDLDNYDSSDDEQSVEQAAKKKLKQYNNVFNVTEEDKMLAFQDPILTQQQQLSDSEDEEDFDIIKPTDNVFVATSCEDDACTLEVFVYDDEEAAMYVHHDIMLNAYPLCCDYVSLGSDGNSKNQKNFCAVGQFDNNIDIWDLDVVDVMKPVLTLGNDLELEKQYEKEYGESSSSASKKSGKKKKVPKKPAHAMSSNISGGSKPTKTREEYGLTGHTGAVMCLQANPFKRNVLASGSADCTVKLWDLHENKCVHTFGKIHNDKVQVTKWHLEEESVLLTAGFDRKMCLSDVRNGDDRVIQVPLTADAEAAIWNLNNTNLCYIATEDGKVCCYDARKLISSSSSNSSSQQNASLWTLQAYNTKTACSGICQVGDIMVTSGLDGVAKVWDLKNTGMEEGTNVSIGSIGAPALLSEKGLSAGPLFSCQGGDGKVNSEAMFIFGGNTVALWDLRSERRLCERFGWQWDGRKEKDEVEG